MGKKYCRYCHYSLLIKVSFVDRAGRLTRGRYCSTCKRGVVGGEKIGQGWFV